MRKGLIWLAVILAWVAAVLLLAGVGPAEAMTDDPGGFRGAKWGDPPESIPGLVVSAHTDDLVSYMRPGDGKVIDGVAVQSILYFFWEDRLLFVGVAVADENAVPLHRACERRFGQPDKIASLSATWRGPETVVKWERKGDRASLVIASKRLQEERVALHLKQSKMREQESYRKKGW